MISSRDIPLYHEPDLDATSQTISPGAAAAGAAPAILVDSSTVVTTSEESSCTIVCTCTSLGVQLLRVRYVLFRVSVPCA